MKALLFMLLRITVMEKLCDFCYSEVLILLFEINTKASIHFFEYNFIVEGNTSYPLISGRNWPNKKKKIQKLCLRKVARNHFQLHWITI